MLREIELINNKNGFIVKTQQIKLILLNYQKPNYGKLHQVQYDTKKNT